MSSSNASGWLSGRGNRLCNANLNHVTWPRVQTLGWLVSVVALQYAISRVIVIE